MATDYQATKAWSTAIALGKPLTLITEELPAQEDHGLIMTIQGLMVELPAAIALDILVGTESMTRRAVLLKLQSSIEIIDMVYPALDTVGLKGQIVDLFNHCESDEFGKVDAPSKPTPEVTEDGSTPITMASVEPAPDVADSKPESEPEPASDAESNVTITDPSLLEPTPASEATPAVSVAVTPDPATAQPRV